MTYTKERLVWFGIKYAIYLSGMALLLLAATVAGDYPVGFHVLMLFLLGLLVVELVRFCPYLRSVMTSSREFYD